eukprot:4035224-Pleurochrysis_carterae.AAC.5
MGLRNDTRIPCATGLCLLRWQEATFAETAALLQSAPALGASATMLRAWGRWIKGAAARALGRSTQAAHAQRALAFRAAALFDHWRQSAERRFLIAQKLSLGTLVLARGRLRRCWKLWE